MSKIKSRGSKIEMKMKAALEDNRIEYEYQPKVFGNPDFLVPPNIAIFCDSSFWHGRHWKKLEKQLHKPYWREHIQKNRERDRLVNRALRKQGYIVLRFWDNEIEKQIEKCISKIKENVKSQVRCSEGCVHIEGGRA